ncbi:MAG: class I tRNA ligase family protein [Candidatus Liptonbacteria bacterium]|nr:class I tRNA ligase family protein [Candidatus Liptonbacteria bacterium]
MKYDFKKIEAKWRKKWLKKKTYEPDLKKARNPFYNLMMFPYPSAEGLHVGNAYAFIGSDIYGRFKRMKGEDVFEPIGLDGFGIHSENYALKIGAHPAKQAKVSEKRFYKQLASLGNGFSWDEKLETYDPAYYKWTQWIFTQLFKKGLAYRKKQPVNWCPSCKTVLADEQVLQKSQIPNLKSETNSKSQIKSSKQKITIGVCERCDTKVIKKELEQWFFKITDYAEKLLKNIDGLDWSEKVKIAQRNWIGKSEGAELDFEVKTKDKPNFVLLHGYMGSPKDNFRPWLKKELERRGAKVCVPTLPHTKNPRVAEQVEFVLKNVPFNKDTVLLGHSLGAIVALKVLEKLKQPIRRSVLVAGFTENNFLDHDRFDENTFDWKFNAKRIRTNSGDLRILRDTTDEIIPPDQAPKLQNLFGGIITEFVAREPHACGKQEQEVLRSCIDSIRVFTTRPDTLFGATYMVLAPEHELISKLKSKISNFKEVESYVKKAKKKSEEDRIAEGQIKTGVELKGIKAINPTNGKEIPVWVADYVLTGYGTGAIMAVPAHDERDFEFARKYKLPVEQVVAPYFYAKEGKDAIRNDKKTIKRKTAYAFLWDRKNNRYLCLDWEKFGWHSGIIGGVEDGEDYIKAGKREISEETGYKNIKFVKYLGGEVHNHFFAAHKDENRYAIGQGMLFELVNDKKSDVAPEDLKNHKPVWIEPAKMRDWLNLSNFQYMWQILESGKECSADYGIAINSNKFDGLESEKAKWEITKFVEGKRKTQFRLRDWLISRQRYWGPPIPLVFCENCKKQAQNYADNTRTSAEKFPRNSAVSPHKSAFSRGEIENPGWIAVPENKLPVKLPFVKEFQPKGTGKSPLAMVKSFYETKCPKCGGKARRETDVSDTFLDSSWYFLRYPSIKIPNSKIQITNKFQNPNYKTKVEIPWNQEITKRWLPVNMYIGGAEHSVLHLLYSRFITMFFKDCGLVDFEEPFTKFRAHGLLIKEGTKMSKSKGNVVNPDEYIKNFGADTLRMYLMFLAPFEYGGDFRDAGIVGIKRFLERTWKLYSDKRHEALDMEKTKEDKELQRLLHQTIKKVTDDVENLRYNTAISSLMILLNKMEEKKSLSQFTLNSFLKLLAPFAPHMTEELWQRTQRQPVFKSVHSEAWPEYDEKLLKAETFTLIIQVNGKIRDTVEAQTGISREEAEKLALGREKIENIIKSSAVEKIVYVPGRLINIVV